MTNKEAIEILKELPDRIVSVLMPLDIDFDYKEALDLAIKALEFTESQKACCDNCVNHTRKSKEVCTSPYGQCEFFEDKDAKQGPIPYTWLTGVQ